MDEFLRHKVFLGALLHDIGKFYQRADKSLLDEYNSLSSYSKRIAEDICPINEYGRFGYQHVIWTNEFFEKFFNDIFKNVSGLKTSASFKVSEDDSLESLSCNHHKPQNELQGLISLADWWSAGIDRNNPASLERDVLDKERTIQWGRDRYRHIPLYSIFNSIYGRNNNSAFALNPLGIEESCFFPEPVNSVNDGVNQEEYNKLWKQFCNELSSLPTNSYEGFSESLIYLIKKYTWCIPSNTMDMSNVSLYEHLKTTAAFADCFYIYREFDKEAFRWNGTRVTLKDGVKPVILLGGDVSGIQNFIYNISSKKAASSLKGRSFYIQLLIDSVIQRIISHPDIKVSIANVIYSSGGKFYMLLPNTPEVIKSINDLKTELEKELWNKHRGALLLNIDYVPFVFDVKTRKVDFKGADNDSTIGDLWRVLAEKLTECKNVKFKSIVLSKDFFEQEEISSDMKVCVVTGIEGKCCNIAKGGEEQMWVLPSVKEQIKLGDILKDVNFIVTHLGREGSNYMANRSTLHLEIVGVDTYLFDKRELDDEHPEFKGISSADLCRVTSVNSLNIPRIKGQSCSYAYKFYGGNRQAIAWGNNKTFEELADEEYLGVLRMDVDNLGSLFVKGLPEESKSFAAYSTLSFMLDWFFSGYINTIREKYKDDVNIIYSGGDDVFAVGKWDKVLLFAKEVRKSFSRFVGRDDISISAGVVFIPCDYPIAKAAQLSGDAENSAKCFEGKHGQQKNAINMFGQNVSWEGEFDGVETLKCEFVDLVEKESMPKSILHRIMVLCETMKRGDPSYMWRTAYYLTRFSNGKSRAVQSFCNNLKIKLTDKREYELAAIAARWAEFELRFNV